jgi:hypothetical protein
MQTNAANPAKVKEAGDREKLLKKQETEDLKAVLSSVAGRRFLHRQLSVCGIYRTSMTGTVYTYYNEGARQVGLNLMAEIEEADIEAYALLVRENRKVSS